MKSDVFKVELEQDDDGRWSAVVPALPGCAVWDYTVEEAMVAMHEAAQAYIQVLLEDGRPVPLKQAETVVDGPVVSVVSVA